MSYPPPPSGISLAAAPPPLRKLERVALVGGGCVLIGLLVTAALLTPNPAGLGTHHQLGLPPCTLRQLFGIRCPSCGMTTSWAHLTHGNPVAAWRANAGGALLALLAAWCGPWLLVSGICGWWVIQPPRELITILIAVTVVAVILLDWTLRLSLGW